MYQVRNVKGKSDKSQDEARIAQHGLGGARTTDLEIARIARKLCWRGQKNVVKGGGLSDGDIVVPPNIWQEVIRRLERPIRKPTTKAVRDLIVRPYMRVCYITLVQGERFDLHNLIETLDEVLGGDVYITDERMIAALKKEGVLKSGGNSRWMTSAEGSKSLKAFVKTLRELLAQAEERTVGKKIEFED